MEENKNLTPETEESVNPAVNETADTAPEKGKKSKKEKKHLKDF